MKKSLFLYVFTFCIALAVISGCVKTPNQEVMIFTDYPYYDTVEKIKKEADIIIEGRIISANTVLLDLTETLTDEEKKNPKLNPGGEIDIVSLPYTIYQVEIQKTYKGKVSVGDTIQFKRLGGTIGNIDYIEEDAMNIEVGGTYILFLETYSNSPASLINQIQGIYNYGDKKIKGNSKNKLTLDIEDLG